MRSERARCVELLTHARTPLLMTEHANDFVIQPKAAILIKYFISTYLWFPQWQVDHWESKRGYSGKSAEGCKLFTACMGQGFMVDIQTVTLVH